MPYPRSAMFVTFTYNYLQYQNITTEHVLCGNKRKLELNKTNIDNFSRYTISYCFMLRVKSQEFPKRIKTHFQRIVTIVQYYIYLLVYYNTGRTDVPRRRQTEPRPFYPPRNGTTLRSRNGLAQIRPKENVRFGANSEEVARRHARNANHPRRLPGLHSTAHVPATRHLRLLQRWLGPPEIVESLPTHLQGNLQAVHADRRRGHSSR